MTSDCSCYDTTGPVSCPGTAGDVACATTPFCGQDAQYDDGGRALTCTNADGSLQDPCDAEADQDEVVVDTHTGLMWQRSWIRGSGSLRSLANACGLTYAGYSDWRLPSLMEYQSIVDYGRANPAIDLAGFPGTSDDCFIGSIRSDTVDAIPGIRFSDGSACSIPAQTYRGIFGVRCVRLGPVDHGMERFDYWAMMKARCETSETVPDQPVGIDILSGLMWQLNPGSEDTWQEALSYCEGLTYGGHDDWRLPNFKEHRSSAAFALGGRGANLCYIPNGNWAGNYWSSTSCVGSPTSAWVITYGAEQSCSLYGAAWSCGDWQCEDKTVQHSVYCVRSG